MKLLKRWCKAWKVLQGNARAERSFRNVVPTDWEEKSFEGLNPRALEAEKGFLG